MCTFIGASFLISLFISAMFSSYFLSMEEAPSLPDEMVLYLPLDEGFPEHRIYDDFGYDFAGQPTFREAIDAIDHAQTDGRVKGIVAVAGAGQFSLAQIQELRAAIKRFRSTGKFAHIYAESFDVMSGSLSGYYLASAFEKIWMQPVGNLSIPGARAEIPYVRGMLDKIGIEPEFLARKEYKDIFDSAMDREMAPESRVAMESLIGDLSKNIVTDVSADRAMTADVLRGHIDKGILTDKEALEAKLIDRLDYLDVLKAEVRKTVTGSDDPESLKFIKFARYAGDVHDSKLAAMTDDRPIVALVYAVGAIASDDGVSSSRAGLYDEDVVSAKDLARAIEEVARDESVTAIVLRIDSPGGSPGASETIRRAVIFAKEKGKKVVVSMGGVAASGGYWIAAPADYIFAMPLTVTGSIGVAGGKLSMAGLWNKTGVNWDSVSWGANSAINSFNEPYTEAGLQRMNVIMDAIYDDFVARVAEGRKMTPAQVDLVARGRVWTGNQALEAKLVDALGGINEALDYAAVLSGHKSRRDVHIEIMPAPKSPFDQIIEFLEMQSRAGEGLKVVAHVADIFRPVGASLSERGAVSLPAGFEIR